METVVIEEHNQLIWLRKLGIRLQNLTRKHGFDIYVSQFIKFYVQHAAD